jgi:F-type H+/Na+-transporting ATPase subunit beta
MTRAAPSANNYGHVRSVRGSVIECTFPRLPDMLNELRAGVEDEIVIEVLSHLNADTIRGIALTPTKGLARGAEVRDTGHRLQVPVGPRLLGRVFNVFGETTDGGDPLEDVQWRSIHQIPVSLSEHSTKREIFTTGIKAIDILTPLERGGKAGLSAVPASARPSSSWR